MYDIRARLVHMIW